MGDTSRQKSVDVEQLMQRVKVQFLKWGRSGRSARCDFSKKKLRERCEWLGHEEKERSPSYSSKLDFAFRVVTDAPALDTTSLAS